jgi:hypothetical protein
MEGAGSGSLPLTKGSGSPKNLRIRILSTVHIKYLFNYTHPLPTFPGLNSSLVLDSTAAASAADGRYSG